jgi:hypothetical protein
MFLFFKNYFYINLLKQLENIKKKLILFLFFFKIPFQLNF